MGEPAFYDVPCSEPGIGSWFVIPLRRLARRLLRPFLYRQGEINAELQAQTTRLEARVTDLRAEIGELLQRQKRLEAFDCDAHALARRLAVIEDYLQAVLQPVSTTSEVHQTSVLANPPRLEVFPKLPLADREDKSFCSG